MAAHASALARASETENATGSLNHDGLTTVITVSQDAVWSNWNNQYVLATSANQTTWNLSFTTNQVWLVWNEAYTSVNNATGIADYEAELQAEYRQYQQYQQQQHQQQYQQRARQAAEEKAAATLRARKLLLDWLDEDQQTSFEKHQHFIVHSRDGQRKYRIKRGRAGNVELLGPAGKAVAKFCIHPSISCPDEDTMLSQKLLLETDEESFLRIANRTAVA